jgi:hypothetical protein
MMYIAESPAVIEPVKPGSLRIRDLTRPQHSDSLIIVWEVGYIER